MGEPRKGVLILVAQSDTLSALLRDVVGTIGANGSVTATCDYGHSYLLGHGSGVLTIGVNGHLAGAIAWHNGSTDMGTSTFDLVKQ
jgi:hypothetical protein